MNEITIRRGHIGYLTVDLQFLLKRRGLLTAIGGRFDEDLEKVVRAFQHSAGLVVDGIVGPETWSALKGVDCSRLLQDVDLVKSAKRLGLPLAVVNAVNEVESAGEGFLKGQVRILFERHQMRRQLLTNRPDLDVTSLQATFPNVVNELTGGYSGGAGEWTRLAIARRIDEQSALESCSWGAFQIMGFHWRRLGYSSVAELAKDMQRSESAQFGAFVRFVETDPKLHTALKARDWAAFASRYNGPAYAKNKYDTKLASAYERYAGSGCAVPNA